MKQSRIQAGVVTRDQRGRSTVREIQGRGREAINRNQNQKQTKADKGQAGIVVINQKVTRLSESLNKAYKELGNR